MAFEDVRDDWVAEIGPYLNEVDLVRRLRDEATLALDTVRFERLYELDG